MQLVPFDEILPDLAQREARGWTATAQAAMPPGDYGLIEFFCPDPTCDCCRVSLLVVRRGTAKPDAMISHALQGGDLDPQLGRTYLDPLHHQSPHAGALLKFVLAMLRTDPSWTERLERHYALTKAAVADPKHPCHARLAKTADRPQAEPGSQLAPGTVGTAGNPLRLRVPDETMASSIRAIAGQLGVCFVVEVVPGRPADMGDLDHVGSFRPTVPSPTRPARPASAVSRRRR